MNSIFILIMTCITLAPLNLQAQTRVDRVKKLSYRLMNITDSTKNKLLKEAYYIYSQLDFDNIGTLPYQRAFVKRLRKKITPLSLDTTLNMGDNRRLLDNLWNDNDIETTYFIFNGYSRDGATNKFTSRFIVIEIEEASLTGTVQIFFPIKLIKGKWQLVRSKQIPELNYDERS